MRYFIDTEFIESGHKRPLHLISIGIKCEDGREYYAELEDCPLHLANDWVKANVIPHLHGSFACPRHVVAEEILAFVAAGGRDPSFWAYFADYDWVVFAQLFGDMADLPSGWPMYCLDLKQVWATLGSCCGEVLLPEPKDEHHSLSDAVWNFEAWKILNAKWKELTGRDLP